MGTTTRSAGWLWIAAAVGCQRTAEGFESSLVDSGDTSVDGTEIGTTDDVRDTDGDLYCDPSGFEVFEPLWYVELTGAPDKPFSVWSIAFADQAIFVAGEYHAGAGGFLERRSLAGEREWIVDEPSMSWVIATDTEHVYFGAWGSDERVHRRALEDGEADIEWFVAPPLDQILQIDATHDQLLVAGLSSSQPPADAQFGWYSKSVTNTELGFVTVGTAEIDDYPVSVVARTSGGWAASVANISSPFTTLLGLGVGGIDLEVQLPLDPFGWGHGLIEHGDQLLLLAEEGDFVPRSWMLSIDGSGHEQWRKLLSPCGEVPTRVAAMSKSAATDGVWAVLTATTGPEVDIFTDEPLLVHLGFDGDIEGVWTLDPPSSGARWEPRQVVTNGDSIYLVLYTLDLDDVGRTWLAQIR